MAGLPLAERAARLRADADLRARLVAEVKAAGGGLFARSQTSFDNMYPLGAPKPEYEPDPSTSVAAIAARSGEDPVAVMLDVIAEGDGHQLLNVPLFNFSYGSFDAVKEMLEHPTSGARPRRRRRPLQRHLRRVHGDVDAHPLDPRPRPATASPSSGS